MGLICRLIKNASVFSVEDHERIASMTCSEPASPGFVVQLYPKDKDKIRVNYLTQRATFLLHCKNHDSQKTFAFLWNLYNEQRYRSYMYMHIIICIARKLNGRTCFMDQCINSISLKSLVVQFKTGYWFWWVLACKWFITCSCFWYSFTCFFPIWLVSFYIVY